MSVEVTLYPRKASKAGLVRFLKSNGFKRARHFIEALNSEDSTHFIWFGIDNYESSTGVEASVQQSSLQSKKKYKCSDWVLHTRTRSSGSYEDKRKQNEIIRTAKQQFGGTFLNDWYGTNRYTNLSHYKQFTPLEKAISIVCGNSLEKLSQIRDCLNGYSNETSEVLSIAPVSIRSMLVSKDPSIVLYNSLMPFLVSVLEYFFGECFTSYIKYNSTAKNLLIDEKVKLAVSDVVGIIQKQYSLEDFIAKTYNFQNLDSINRAYRKYTSIDVLATLSVKKRVNKHIFRVLTRVQEILLIRHKFVHELDINYCLTKQVYLDYVGAVENAIKLMMEAFEEKGLVIEVRY